SSCRIKSGDASASASASTVPGSTMCGAVIVLMPFERVVRDSSKDHTVTASTSSPTRLATERYTTMRDSTGAAHRPRRLMHPRHVHPRGPAASLPSGVFQHVVKRFRQVPDCFGPGAVRAELVAGELLTPHDLGTIDLRERHR